MPSPSRENNFLRDLTRERFVYRLAHTFDELNHLHRFRDGNGPGSGFLCWGVGGAGRLPTRQTTVTPAENVAASGDGERTLRVLLDRIVTDRRHSSHLGAVEWLSELGFPKPSAKDRVSI